MLTPVSLIDERDSQRVRMGHLAFVGSYRINSVSALHTELMRKTTFRQLHELYADRIVNKTNGITFRRWLMQANPGLTKLLCEVCGAAVLDDQTTMVRLADHANDASLQERFRAVKRANKVALSRLIYERLELRIDPHALFDVQIKRIHEYKRQLLNLLETIALYTEMRSEPNRSWVPRVKIFAGKAAASYTQAKLIIKLANDVATVVNNDPAVRDFLKVVFIPNYNVSLAESIIPAAELSEQISTAGMEASGTGNMKLALNGALTIGTLDGANIEIRDHVGADNIFIFGLKAHEVEERRRSALDATDTIAASPTQLGCSPYAQPHHFRSLTPMCLPADFGTGSRGARQTRGDGDRRHAPIKRSQLSRCLRSRTHALFREISSRDVTSGNSMNSHLFANVIHASRMRA